jgi:hypothetical protein
VHVGKAWKDSEGTVPVPKEHDKVHVPDWEDAKEPKWAGKEVRIGRERERGLMMMAMGVFFFSGRERREEKQTLTNRQNAAAAFENQKTQQAKEPKEPKEPKHNDGSEMQLDPYVPENGDKVAPAKAAPAAAAPVKA